MPDLQEGLTEALSDRYVIESEIGRGGMAVVLLAEDLKHHRKVAIKVLHPELAASVGPERFLREIEAVAGLTHPHVLPLHDSGEADGLLFYVMPYVEGESLRQRLDRERHMPVDDAVRIGREVAEALDYAHRQGLIHRDIKPGNILLEDGHAVVTDFGVARAITAAGEERVTATGMTVGTPAYMSPEQAAGEAVDERCDLYALGCVLYEMLAGEPPLVGSSAQSTAARRLTDRPTPLPALRDTVPPELDRAVARALEKVPTDRYATAAEFSEALGSAIAGADRGAPARRRARVGLVSAIVFSIAAVAAWLALRPPGVRTSLDSGGIAVLPFLDLSEKGDQGYFADGVSEELLNLLARIPELRVTSRSSSFSFRDRNLDIREIAERLNVANVLEGSVRKAGENVRITAQLIDARSDEQVWSKTWDRTLDDIFATQEEIAADVVAQLEITLLRAAPTIREANPEAYALFLQARQLGRQGSAEGYERSNRLLKQALAIDSAYAPAWALLALNRRIQSTVGLRPPDEGVRLAREAANRALEIDPEYAPAYATLSRIAGDHDKDLAAAARHLQRALELGPADTDILADAALLSAHLGRLDEAVALLEAAVERDPVNPRLYNNLGVNYLWAERWDQAIASFRTALDLAPDRVAAHQHVGRALLGKGEPEAALEAIQREPAEVWREIGLAMVYHSLGRGTEADSVLAELIEKYERDGAYNIAYVYAYRDEADRAFEWLRKAVEYGDLGLSEIPAQSLFANLHHDPRWLPFLESIGRSPAQLAAIDFEVTLPQQGTRSGG